MLSSLGESKIISLFIKLYASVIYLMCFVQDRKAGQDTRTQAHNESDTPSETEF